MKSAVYGVLKELKNVLILQIYTLDNENIKFCQNIFS